MAAIKRIAPDDGARKSKKQKQTPHGEPASKVASLNATSATSEGKPKNVHSTTSRESHQKQKAVAKERKQSKPNADSVQRSKQLWERLRRKSHVPKEERKELVKELFEIVTGHVQEYVFKHDSVRVIQCALKYANEEQRNTIATELKGTFKTLGESKYGKFLAAKLLVTGNVKVKDTIISEFYGRVRQMINHPEASWILDDTYRQVATTKQKASLLREWYGPEFVIFKAPAADKKPTADLTEILEDNPEKRKPILKYLIDLINQLIQKKMTGFTMLHDAMLQYSIAVGSPHSSENAAEFIELLKGDEEGDLLKNLAFTKAGARVVCRAIASSSAKDRKLILRAFKDIIPDLAHDPNGMHIILAAYETIDDTVMTSKSIIFELLGTKLGTEEERCDHIIEQATHLTARIPLLYPFATGKARWLIPQQSDTAALVDEMRTLRAQTSKKDPEIRRQELVKSLCQNNVLLSTVETRASQLAQSSFGCQFITEIILNCDEHGESGKVEKNEGSASKNHGASGKRERSESTTAEGSGGKKTATMAAVADLARGDPTEEGHIAHSSHAGKMLRTLAMGQKYDPIRSKEEQQWVVARTLKEDREGVESIDRVVENGAVDGTANGTDSKGDGERQSRQPPRLGFAELLYARIKPHLLAWATGENSFVVANFFDDRGFKEKGDVIKRLRKNIGRLQEVSGEGNRGASLLLVSM